MKKYLKYFLPIIICVTTVLKAQDDKARIAREAYEDYSYVEAIEAYEKMVDKGLSENEAFTNLGDAYYFNAKYQEAAIWYKKTVEKEESNIDYEVLYRYAHCLRSIGNYEESDKWMEKFLKDNQDDQRALKFIKNRNYLEKIRKRKDTYTVKNIDVNSRESDFAPSIKDGHLVFSSARDSGKVFKHRSKWNNKAFLDLYITPVGENGEVGVISPLNKEINTKAHESSITFSKDGFTAYFTRNNDSKGSLSRDKDGVSRLKLYKASNVNGVWKSIVELPFNDDSYSVSHPALSPDGKRLYFASDMPGTLGKSDIFYVDINDDGTFGSPINLGEKINTPSRETFPFIDDSEVLYFASDGHPGLGGLDIFATNTGRPYVVNLGEPLNGPQDDFSLIYDSANQTGYFASNRENGKGDDDIYGFVKERPLDLDCQLLVQGVIRGSESKNPISNVHLSIQTKENGILKSTSSEKGMFTVELPCQEEKLVVSSFHEDYIEKSIELPMDGADSLVQIAMELEKKEERAIVGSDLSKVLDLNNIYFDFGKWSIREDAKIELNKILDYMKEYPELKIRIGSYTDSRGTKNYNLRLSKKRANSTLEFFISNGINPLRITSEGFGEASLANDCKDNVPCTKKKHQENRRSEFVVVE